MQNRRIVRDNVVSVGRVTARDKSDVPRDDTST